MNCKTYNHYDSGYDRFCKLNPLRSLKSSPLQAPKMICDGEDYVPKTNKE